MCVPMCIVRVCVGCVLVWRFRNLAVRMYLHKTPVHESKTLHVGGLRCLCTDTSKNHARLFTSNLCKIMLYYDYIRMKLFRKLTY